MNQECLHLVDSQGMSVSPDIEAAVGQAFRWVSRDYPRMDPAQLANWAESVASAMQVRRTSLESPRRYAYTALKGRVLDWLRTGTAREESAGMGHDLERISGVGHSFQGAVERKILFGQLQAALNERDRSILVLLLQDKTSPATIAESLGITYPAAAKAIQRVKERVSALLRDTHRNADKSDRSALFYGAKGKPAL